jgi:hypothetical protein
LALAAEDRGESLAFRRAEDRESSSPSEELLMRGEALAPDLTLDTVADRGVIGVLPPMSRELDRELLSDGTPSPVAPAAVAEEEEVGEVGVVSEEADRDACMLLW